MKFEEDSRMRHSRRTLFLAWIFFFAYLLAIMLTSYLLGVQPLFWGLPRWVAVGNIIVPVVFVLLLILVVEKGIPDIPLSDEEKEKEDDE